MIPIERRHLMLCLFGASLGIFGLLFSVFTETMLDVIMEKVMILRPDSLIFDLWKSPPFKLVTNVYFYNWTNSADFGNHSVKPILEELGPYSFIENHNKDDIDWHPQNASVSYRKISYYIFDAVNSKGSLDDPIVTANFLAVTTAAKANQYGSFRRNLLELALTINGHNMVLKKTARELLFDGFYDGLINMAKMFPSISKVSIPLDRISFGYGRNGSSLFFGHLNVHTGANDIRKLGQIHTWNFRTSTPIYSQECGKPSGTAGEFQAPHLKKNGSIEIFAPEICRGIMLDYVGIQEVDGITGYRYEGGLRSVDNGTIYAENYCYCNGECVPSGLMNISSCIFDVPIFMSYPHFYNADSFYAEQVIGQSPDKKKHVFYVVLEPRTGFVLELAGRMQVNLLIKPLPNFRFLRNSRKIFFPHLWVERKTRVSHKLAGYMRLVPQIVLGSQLFGCLCSLFGFLLFARYILLNFLKTRSMQQIEINDNEVENRHEKRVAVTLEFPPLLNNNDHVKREATKQQGLIRTQALEDSSSMPE